MIHKGIGSPELKWMGLSPEMTPPYAELLSSSLIMEAGIIPALQPFGGRWTGSFDEKGEEPERFQ